MGKNFLKNLFMTVIILSIGVLLTIYLYGISYYKTHYFPNTYINNIDISGKTFVEADNMLKKELTTYELSITDKYGKVEKIKGKDFDYTKEISDDISNILKVQNKFTWMFNVHNAYDIDFNSNYDEQKLKKAVSSLTFIDGENIKEPINAYVEKTDNGYKIVKEDNGGLIDFDKLFNLVLTAVKEEKTSLIISDDCYLLADIDENHESIVSFMEKANKLNDLVIIYDFKDRKEIVDFKVFKDWVDITEDKDIVIDDKKIKEYITGLAEKYDTYKKERIFKTSDNKEIKISGGIYGWQTDINKTKEQLIDAINKLESITLEPIYKIKAIKRDVDDIGDTYIEISLNKQYMWFYKDNKLIVETDIITGIPNSSRETPTGVFTLWSRETNRYLTGDTYRSWVNYWMPISWDGIGIHDASWRTSFGGNLYKSKGSHGCINTPFEAVKTIYENSYTGIPVIVYK